MSCCEAYFAVHRDSNFVRWPNPEAESCRLLPVLPSYEAFASPVIFF